MFEDGENFEEIERSFTNTLLKSQVERYNLRTSFESRIERTYYHVQPVDENEILAWYQYLEFEIQQKRSKSSHRNNDGKHHPNKAVQRLFERCLIPCAHYTEFWRWYAEWTDENGDFEQSEQICQRALKYFLQGRADMYIFYAKLLESHNKIEEARNVYRDLWSSISPGLVEAILEWINLEKRNKNYDYVLELFDRLLKHCEESDKVFINMKLSDYYLKTMNDLNSARKTLHETIKSFSSDFSLWIEFASMELNFGDLEHFQKICQLAIKDQCDLTINNKSQIWEFYIDGLSSTRLNCPISELLKAEQQYNNWKRKQQLGIKFSPS